ncbi:hypothetical protein CPB83DRAFT_308861 [Crepidotus variabilis]|uniref:Uncharacterized protein n=1 Tax=Crepidotus variabilis TaxID=179855 RepID=A0A9P6EGL5_9AGAR|nr:hypothetical protein CPB83DRAFT_308861 [Crepidotus variabilis]
MGASIIVDDADPKLQPYFSGDQWGLEPGTGDSLLNGTLTSCHLEKKSFYPTPTFSLYFYGSDFSLYGPGLSGVALNYTIDDTSVRPATDFNNSASTNLKAGVKLWSLTGLDTSYHTLKLIPASGLFAFDYFTYTPSKYTTLTGSRLIVDDADSLIQYSGNNHWTKLNSQIFGNGMPYQSTLSSSSQKGSTLKFDFTGSSIAVYGALNQQSGTLSAQFTVDNGTATTFTPFNGTQAVDPSSWKINQQLYYKDLAPGKHSLQLTLSDISGSQALYIDSLVYEGTSGTTLSAANPSATGDSAFSSPSSSFFSSAKIGGIVAAAVALAFVACCLRICCVRRRRVIQQPNQPPTLLLVHQNQKPPPIFSPPSFNRHESAWSSNSRFTPSSPPETPFTMPTPMPPPPPPHQGPPAINSLLGLLSRTPDATTNPGMPTPVVPTGIPTTPTHPAQHMDGSDEPARPAALMRERETGSGPAPAPPPYRERTSTDTLE